MRRLNLLGFGSRGGPISTGWNNTAAAIVVTSDSVSGSGRCRRREVNIDRAKSDTLELEDRTVHRRVNFSPRLADHENTVKIDVRASVHADESKE